MNILIAGASGYIGSYLYNRFHKNYSITPVDLTHIQDVETLTEKLPKCDAFIFLVGLAHKKGRDNKLNREIV
jgi:nucleoside-diphosphate-sugar epimerase